MADEDTDLGQGPSQDPDGGDSSPSQQQGGSAGAGGADEVERLKQENARYRQELREARADQLVTKHSLPAGLTSLLAGLPRDKMEQKAQELAEEMKASGEQAPATETQGDAAGEEPPKEPEGAEGLKGMQGEPEGQPKTTPPPTSDDEFLKQVNGAKSEKELLRIVQGRQNESIAERQAAFERDQSQREQQQQ